MSLINWDSIDTVLLDMDGTLLDLNFDNFFWMKHLPKRYCDIHGGDIDQVRMDLYRKIMSQKGNQIWYDLSYWAQELDVDICALKREIQHLIQPLPNTMAFLNAMHKMDKACYIVTNAHEDSLNIKMDNVDLVHHFKRIVVAFEYNHPKEEAEFWPLLQQDLQYDPQKTLFVDDNADVIKMAEQSGIAEVVGLLCPDSQGTHNEMPLARKTAMTLGDLL